MIRPKFKLIKKGIISQYWGENKNPIYANKGEAGHAGIDWNIGYGESVHTDNDAYVYRTLDADLGTQGASGYTAVYVLVDMGDDYYMSIKYGHLSKIFVKEGQWIPEGYVLGTEGNTGTVYSGGVKLEDGDPLKGERGSHVHEEWTPVKKEQTITAGKYITKWGSPLQVDGFFYRHVLENEYRDSVDPITYVHKNTFKENLRMVKRHLAYTLNRFAPMLRKKG